MNITKILMNILQKKSIMALLLFLPTCLQAQVSHTLQDVNVTETRPHYVRMKGYYRSYQHNDSTLKYFVDGIVEYYINLKNGKVDLNKYARRNLRNNILVSQDRKRAFSYNDQGTFRPWPEGKTFIELCRKQYTLKDSLGTQYIMLGDKPIGRISKSSTSEKDSTYHSRGICQVEINLIPTYKNLTHNIFGFTQEDIKDDFVESYQLSPEDYYSFKDLLAQKTDKSYLFSYKKDTHKQLIHVITELYITEKEYAAKKNSINSVSLSPKKATEVIDDFCTSQKIAALPDDVEEEMKLLTPYNPATLKDVNWE